VNEMDVSPKAAKSKRIRSKAKPKAVKHPSRASNEKPAAIKRVSGEKRSAVAESKTPSVGGRATSRG
jgi:hypothetical protein